MLTEFLTLNGKILSLIKDTGSQMLQSPSTLKVDDTFSIYSAISAQEIHCYLAQLAILLHIRSRLVSWEKTYVAILGF